MAHGEASADVFGLDIARYGAYASNREYIRQTTGEFYARRFVMTYPNEQLPAGRPLKATPAHDAMTAAGCHWGNSWGLEVPLFFAPAGFTEKPTLKRSNAFDIVGAECRAVREDVGVLDIASFSRYEVTGAEAGRWLDWLMASRLPKPGRARLAPMLSETGKLKGDLAIINWGDGTFWIEGSYYLRQWHMRWFADHAREGVRVRDISDEVIGFSLAGPSPTPRCRSWARRSSTLVWCGRRSRASRSPANSDTRSIAARSSTRPCAGPFCRRDRISAPGNTAITPFWRFGWKRASASGRRSSPKNTRRG